MVTVAPRYQFLADLHEIWQPTGYVEIGVQHGGSLALAKCEALGVDPTPMVLTPLGSNANVVVATSDHFFTQPYQYDVLPRRIDMTFIDGMHLVEYALRDFMNIERRVHRDAVVLFDDVLPYNTMIASRAQPPGDWTGDVWKIIDILTKYRPDLQCMLVDTPPTGTLVVTGLNASDTTLQRNYDKIVAENAHDFTPFAPERIVSRAAAISPSEALDRLRELKETM